MLYKYTPQTYFNHHNSPTHMNAQTTHQYTHVRTHTRTYIGIYTIISIYNHIYIYIRPPSIHTTHSISPTTDPHTLPTTPPMPTPSPTHCHNTFKYLLVLNIMFFVRFLLQYPFCSIHVFEWQLSMLPR